MENLRELTPRFHEGQSILDSAMLRSDSVARNKSSLRAQNPCLSTEGGLCF